MTDKLLEVQPIRIAMPGNQPVLLLFEPETQQVLRIWIGTNEASAIALAQRGIHPPRPMTHQLLVSSLEISGNPVASVRISHVSEDTYYAQLKLKDGQTVDSRASDAVAVAMIADAPVYGAEEVIEEAGLSAESVGLIEEMQDVITGYSRADQVDAPETEKPLDEGSVEEFREFLDQVSPEDFIDPKDRYPDDESDESGQSGE